MLMQKDAEAGQEDTDDDAGGDHPEFEVINRATALWTRSRSEVAEEEYQEFYKHIAHDYQDPLTWSHNRVEGKLEYTSLIYIPSKAPFDLWNRESPEASSFTFSASSLWMRQSNSCLYTYGLSKVSWTQMT